VKKRRPLLPFSLRESWGAAAWNLQGTSPESQFAAWEENRETLSTGHLALWRVKLSDYLNLEIQAILGTDNAGLLAHFWDLLWRLG